MLYVTHRLDEVFALADRVSILRAGRVVLSRPTAECTPAELVAAISGKETTAEASPGESVIAGETPLLEVRDLLGPDVGPLDLSVHRGEVVGLYGVVGSGRTELLETLFGARPRSRGEIRLAGRRVMSRGPADAIAAGIALVPSDRAQKGIFRGLSAQANTVMPLSRRLGRLGLRNRQQERQAFHALGTTLGLHPLRPDLEGQRFSGGNQQKLVVGRWLDQRLGCQVLLLDEPTQGVDVGARAELYAAVRAFAERGGAVLVASSEVGELQQLAHRVAVLSRGCVVATVPSAEITEPRLLELAHLSEQSTDPQGGAA
jgi:ribose transport system ATP-binding protein